MNGKWARKNFPQYEGLNFTQVKRMGGKFHGNRGYATWFVPFASHQPVMAKQRDGTWGPRGF